MRPRVVLAAARLHSPAPRATARIRIPWYASTPAVSITAKRWKARRRSRSAVGTLRNAGSQHVSASARNGTTSFGGSP
jgi:hypothetical protein